MNSNTTPKQIRHWYMTCRSLNLPRLYNKAPQKNTTNINKLDTKVEGQKSDFMVLLVAVGCCCVFWWHKQSIFFSIPSYHFSMLLRFFDAFSYALIFADEFISIFIIHQIRGEGQTTFFLYVLNDDETVSYLVFCGHGMFMSFSLFALFILFFPKSFNICCCCCCCLLCS